jgi:hypothetical protein
MTFHLCAGLTEQRPGIIVYQRTNETQIYKNNKKMHTKTHNTID